MGAASKGISRAAENAVDIQLVDGIKEGNMDALGTLYERHYTPTMMFAYRLLHDIHESENTAQEVFMHIERRPQAFIPKKESKSVRSLIFDSAVSECGMYWRRNKKWRRELPESECYMSLRGGNRLRRELPEYVVGDQPTMLDTFPSRIRDPFEELALKELRGMLRKEIGRLPPQQRNLIELRYLEEMGIRETMKALKISEASVKSSGFKGLRSMKSKHTRALRSFL